MPRAAGPGSGRLGRPNGCRSERIFFFSLGVKVEPLKIQWKMAKHQVVKMSCIVGSGGDEVEQWQYVGESGAQDCRRHPGHREGMNALDHGLSCGFRM